MYLKIPEIFPESDRKIVNYLKTWRNHQYERAKRSYEKSRPPKNNELEFVAFRLFELYNIEEIDVLDKDIRRLLPYVGKDEKFRENMNKLRCNTGMFNWYSLGYISKNIGSHLIGFQNRRIMELPQEVSIILIGLYKILPSIIIVTFDVILDKNATEKLIQMQSYHYKPKLTFGNILPWKIHRGSLKSEDANSIRKKRVSEWMYNLENKIEKHLSFFINGYFLRNNKNGIPSLPAIEIFSMKGIPENDDKIWKWIHQADWWLHSFGFDFYSNFYDQGDMLFIPALTGSKEKSQHYRLIIRDKSAENYIEENHRLKFEMIELLSNLIPCISIVEFLKDISGSIGELKYNTFNIVNNKFKFKNTLSNCIKQNINLNKKNALLNRLQVEFDEYEWSIKLDLKGFESFKNVKYTPNEKQSNLKTFILDSIEYRLERIKSNFEYIEDSLSKYLSVKNIESSNRMQTTHLILTFLLTVLTGVLIWLTCKL